MPRVSVIIPTYNHRDFILETCDSVFAQTYRDYEIIVVNDSSPDDTEAVLRPLIESGKIRYFLQDHGGQAAARNRGIAEARGEYIAFLDDDDLWLADKLEWQVGVLREHLNAVLVYGYCRHLGPDDGWRWPMPDAPSGYVRQPFRTQNWIVSPGQALIRAHTLRDVAGFDEKIWGADDWDLYLRMANWGAFIYQDRPGLLYRVHRNNASKDFWRMFNNSEKLRRKHFGSVPNPLQLSSWLSCRRWITLQFMSHCIEQARDLSLRGDRRAAMNQWWRIVRARPELLADYHVLRGILKSWLNYGMSTPTSPPKPRPGA